MITADPTGGVAIGIDMAHCATLEKDSKGTVPVYKDLRELKNTKSIGVTSNDSSNTEYYDNNPILTANSKGEKNVNFIKSDFSNEEQRFILGHQKTEDGITVEGGDSTPSYLAFGFRTLKSNKAYRYVWLLKGTFKEGDVTTNTREKEVTFQNRSINGTYIIRQCDNQIKIQVDSDDPDISATVIQNWFTLETLNKLYKGVTTSDPEEEDI